MRPTLLLAALALPACTYTRPLDPLDLPAREALNRRTERAASRVRLASGERAPARRLLLTADSASWVDPSTGERRTVPIGELNAVRVEVRPGAGIRDGILIGAGVGLAVGLAVLLGPGEDRGSAPYYAVLSAGQAGAIGALLGGIVGSREEYRLKR